jgi:hypothetical protein
MTPDSLVLTLIAVGLLVCQYLTLRILRECRPQLTDALGILKDSQPHLKDITTNFGDVGDGINESLMELMRIGSDVADQIDSIANGGGVVAPQAHLPKVDMQATIMSLIADKILGGINGGQKEQEWTIQQDDPQTTQNIGGDSDTQTQ